jgi:hypothetical protein
MDTQSFFLWSIWIALLLMNKLFFMFLAGKSFYSLVSGARNLPRLRHLGNQGRFADAITLQRSLLSLHARAVNVNELIDAAFFLFGFVFFLGLRLAFRTPDDSRIPVGALVMQNFLPRFAFAANVFFVLLALL